MQYITYTNLSLNYFNLGRGVKQGDPPSGVLFVLALELLLIKLRNNQNIQGIEINRIEIKLTTYADDLNNFLRTIAAIRETLCELEKFGEISGLLCNLDKVEIMALGSGKEVDVYYKGVKLKWVQALVITGIIIDRFFKITTMSWKNLMAI